MHAQTQKGGVPEEAKIGRSSTPLQIESIQYKLKDHSQTKTVILARMRAAGSDPPRGIAGS